MNRLILAVMAMLISISTAMAQSEKTTGKMEELVVIGERLITPTKETEDTVYTGTEVTRKGIEMQGASTSTSVYETLKIMPSINVESADSRGLGAEQRTIRVRGVRGFLGGLSILGVPNYGGNPIGPRDYVYDMENFDSVAVYMGAVPSDLGVGIGSRGGAIELRPYWPQEDFGAKISASYGSYHYIRSYLRLDTGAIKATNTALSGSFSYTNADKWRGPGELGPRNNINLTLTQPITRDIDLRLWFNHNHQKQHLYRPLTYNQALNLKDNYNLDYNPFPTGRPAEDIDYFDYNKSDLKNSELFGVLTIKLTNDLKINVKPYYSKEDSEILQGVTAGGGQVQKRIRNIDRLGFVTDLSYKITKDIKAMIGYHFERNDMDISTENYGITTAGLQYRGKGVYATSGATYINSPYVKLAASHGRFNWQAGIKYFSFKDSASEGYTTGPAPNYQPIRASDLDREGRTYNIWLPSIGASYDFNPSIQAYSSYGKSFIRPYSYLPIVSLYNSNRQTFISRGITLNDLFKGYDMEESDSVDFGVRIKADNLDITPTLFYGKHRKLLTSIYDPRVNLNYQQNIGKATSYGVQLETNFFISEHFKFFLNPSYVIMKYDEDLIFQGNRLATKGNQVVDTPKAQIKSGFLCSYKGFEVIPSVRFLGSRYGDATNKEKIDSTWITDLQIGYNQILKGIAKEFKVSLELNNLFNKKYVSMITSSDDARQGATSYLQGTPFAAIMKATIVF